MTEVLDGHASAALTLFQQVRFSPSRLFGIALARQALGHAESSRIALRQLIAQGGARRGVPDRQGLRRRRQHRAGSELAGARVRTARRRHGAARGRPVPAPLARRAQIPGVDRPAEHGRLTTVGRPTPGRARRCRSGVRANARAIQSRLQFLSLRVQKALLTQAARRVTPLATRATASASC